jgi:hypothetical protein
VKIRIKGNSIRLRLSRSEVDYFGRHNELEDSVQFVNSKLIYRLLSSADHKEPAADFSDGIITVYIPSANTDEWIKTERVGYEGEMETGNGRKLYILIEKDFMCLDNTVEDQSDNYPNPLADEHGKNR